MEIKKVVEDIDKQSNPVQRAVVAVVVPFAILLLGWGVMSFINKNRYPFDNEWGWCFDPTELNESWWGWFLIVLAIGVFEYFWFRNRSRSDEDASSDN